MNTPGLIETKYVLTITGLYTTMNDEASVKALIRRWRANTGMDDPIKETFIQWVIRRWKGEPVQKTGEIHCLLEMDKDQMVYTAHFH